MKTLRAGVAVCAAVAVGSAGLVLDASSAEAGKRKRTAGTISRVNSPLGVQGRLGGGVAVVLPFTLEHERRKRHFVQLQWGFDQDASGAIDDFEYFAATTALDDARSTAMLRRRRGPLRVKFRSERAPGLANAIVWDSTTDIPDHAFLPFEPVHDAHGRPVYVPGSPGAQAYDPGRMIRVRMRPVLGRRRPKFGDWVVSDPFSLDNTVLPELLLGAATPGDTTLLEWTGIVRTTEDENGDGEFDPREDRDGDLEPDFRPLAIAVDFAPFDGDLAGFDPAGLDFAPASEAEGAADPSLDRPSSPTGVTHTFAWDARSDVGPEGGRFLLEARVYDGVSNRRSAPVYKIVTIPALE